MNLGGASEVQVTAATRCSLTTKKTSRSKDQIQGRSHRFLTRGLIRRKNSSSALDLTETGGTNYNSTTAVSFPVFGFVPFVIVSLKSAGVGIMGGGGIESIVPFFKKHVTLRPLVG